jgi:hypothetical protein
MVPTVLTLSTWIQVVGGRGRHDRDNHCHQRYLRSWVCVGIRRPKPGFAQAACRISTTCALSAQIISAKMIHRPPCRCGPVCSCCTDAGRCVGLGQSIDRAGDRAIRRWLPIHVSLISALIGASSGPALRGSETAHRCVAAYAAAVQCRVSDASS